MLIDLGVTDVIIDSVIGFSIDTLKKETRDIKLRANVNRSVFVTSIDKKNIKTFFIRPEDMELYEDVIDYFDFYSDSIEKEETLFKIYNRNHFNNDFSLLFPYIPYESNNHLIPDRFCEKRLTCKQKCQTVKDNAKHCEACELEMDLVELTEKILKN